MFGISFPKHEVCRMSFATLVVDIDSPPSSRLQRIQGIVVHMVRLILACKERLDPISLDVDNVRLKLIGMMLSK